MEQSKTYQAKNGYIHRKVAGSDVLISVGGNVANFNGYIELNSSAAYLWDQLKTATTSQQLVEKLQENFGISHEVAEEDVLDFLKLFLCHCFSSCVRALWPFVGYIYHSKET